MHTSQLYLPDLRNLKKNALRRLSLLLLLVLVSQAFVRAQTADILFTPSVTNINAGSSFDVTVRVDIQTGTVNAAAIHFNFDPTRLQITNIVRPSSGIFSLETVPLPASPYTTPNTTGHLEYEAGIPAGSIGVDFDILTITFTTAVPPVSGSTALTFTTNPGHITRVVLTGVPLTGSLVNGTVNITNCTTPTATITAATGASICNAQPVGLTLSAATGVSPYDITINGTTYNNVTVGSSFANIPFESSRLFPTDPAPALPVNNDLDDLEYGVRFTSAENGFISGLRFFRPSSNGTYTAKLYNSDRSVLLAYADFPAGGQGWVSVNFSSPVQITAATEYTAAVYSSSGDYAVTNNYFTSAVTSGALTAPAGDGSVNYTSNGIYAYGAAAVPAPGISGPTETAWSSYQNGNYFVDVLFTSNSNTIHFTQVIDDSGCPNTGSPDLQTIVVNSVSCATLPVTLLNLSASPDGNKIRVSWTTTTELNNRGFDVERSVDGTTWTSVGFVAGVGNTTIPTTYHFTDHNLESRRYFYRLKQVDFDDRYKYSTVVSAVVGGRAEYSLGQNYPNPFTNQTTIQFVLPQREDVLLSVHDAGGKLVKMLVRGVKDAGTHAVNFNQGSLARGIYYYKIVAGDFIQMKKMVIQ